MARLTQLLRPSDHVLGPANAAVTLVEYGDYECPYCGQAHPIVQKLLERVGEFTLYAFRHFPLTTVHPHSLIAAQAAEAAGAQGKFWQMHNKMYEHQNALDPASLVLYAQALALDVDRFADDLRDGVHLPRVRSDFSSGVRSGVNGTPSFFVNGERVDEGFGLDALTAAVVRASRQRPARSSRPSADSLL